MNSQKKSYLFALLAILLWSTVASAFKIALSGLPVSLVLFYASVIASIVLFVFYLFDKKARPIKLSDLKKSLLSGFLNPFIYYLILFEAYDLLPAQIAQPLNYTWPIVLSVFSSIVFKQKLKVGVWIGLFVSFVGVVLISSQGSSFSTFNPWGVFLAILSSIIWSIYWIVNMKDKRVESQKLFMNFFIGTFFILGYLLLSKQTFLFPPKAVFASVYIGFFEMGITFFLWMMALKLSPEVSKINNLVFLSPFLSFFFISYILDEKIYLVSVVGLIIIILGIALQKILTR